MWVRWTHTHHATPTCPRRGCVSCVSISLFECSKTKTPYTPTLSLSHFTSFRSLLQFNSSNGPPLMLSPLSFSLSIYYFFLFLYLFIPHTLTFYSINNLFHSWDLHSLFLLFFSDYFRVLLCRLLDPHSFVVVHDSWWTNRATASPRQHPAPPTNPNYLFLKVKVTLSFLFLFFLSCRENFRFLCFFLSTNINRKFFFFFSSLLVTTIWNLNFYYISYFFG